MLLSLLTLFAFFIPAPRNTPQDADTTLYRYGTFTEPSIALDFAVLGYEILRDSRDSTAQRIAFEAWTNNWDEVPLMFRVDGTVTYIYSLIERGKWERVKTLADTLHRDTQRLDMETFPNAFMSRTLSMNSIAQTIAGNSVRAFSYTTYPIQPLTQIPQQHHTLAMWAYLDRENTSLDYASIEARHCTFVRNLGLYLNKDTTPFVACQSPVLEENRLRSTMGYLLVAALAVLAALVPLLVWHRRRRASEAIGGLYATRIDYLNRVLNEADQPPLRSIADFFRRAATLEQAEEAKPLADPVSTYRVFLARELKARGLDQPTSVDAWAKLVRTEANKPRIKHG